MRFRYSKGPVSPGWNQTWIQRERVHSPGGRGEWQRPHVRQKHWGNSHTIANTTLPLLQILSAFACIFPSQSRCVKSIVGSVNRDELTEGYCLYAAGPRFKLGSFLFSILCLEPQRRKQGSVPSLPSVSQIYSPEYYSSQHPTPYSPKEPCTSGLQSQGTSASTHH